MIKRHGHITCAVLTRTSLESMKKRFCEFIERFDLTSPTHVGNCEPIDVPYGGVSDALEHWGDPFLWKSTKTKSEGMVVEGVGGIHSSVYINVSPERGFERSGDLARLLVDLGALLDADFGYVHYVTEAERNHPESEYDALHAIDLGVTTFDLRLGIPGVCWAMLLGAPYSRVADSLRPIANGGFQVEDYGRSAMLRVNVALSSLRTEYEKFMAIGNRIKREVTPPCFGSKQRPATWCPKFE